MFTSIAIYLWQSTVANQKIIMDLGSIKHSWQIYDSVLLLIVLFLLPINWLLEAMKWQRIAANANLSLKQALKGVVLGVTLDNILPASAGAISGRVVTLPKENRYTVIPGILLGQIIQSTITFLFGLYGFWLVWQKASALFIWHPIYTYFALASSMIIVLSIFFWQGKIRKFLQPLWQYTLNSLLMIFAFALARYLVFLMQFMMLSFIFAPDLDQALVFGCATWVFAARTFMPKISNLERLGIRALAVVFFMNLFNQSSSQMLVAVVVLWFINLAIPSIIGLVFFKDIKLGTLLK